jgi:signal transduction histidine kinase/HD-like signal output (HDOD) protein
MSTSTTQLIKEINVEKLPLIPHALIKLIDAFQDNDVDFKQISNIIQKDPALTAKILVVANSATYAQCTFKEFEQMLVVLGMDTVKTIATTASVQQFFSQFNSDTNGHIGKFWLSSLKAAYFSKAIAKLVGYPNLDEAYLGGLIHQIGQLIFFSQYYDEYAQLINESKSASALYDKEIEMFAFSSAQQGSKLINSWDMDSILEDAILYQDAPIEQLFDTPLLIRIINLAHKFSFSISHHESNQENNNEKNQLVFIDQAYQLFGLTQATIEDISRDIQSDIKTAAQSLGIELDENISQIDNSEEYSLFLASRVKNIAIGASTQNITKTDNPQQIISNLMQNIHIVFGLSQCLYFTYNKEQKKLICTAANINTSINLEELSIAVDPPRSLLAKAFNKRSITSSFENKTTLADGIVDRHITRIVKTDGILCIPLFYKAFYKAFSKKFYKQVNKEDFFGVLVVGVSNERYPSLLEQRLLLGDFTRIAARNLNQFIQHQRALEQSNQEHSLHIHKLIHEANNPLTIITNYLQIMSMKMQDSDKNTESQLITLQQEVERVANILLRMKEPVCADNSTIENTHINSLINELVSIFQNSLFKTNHIIDVLNLDESIPVIQCNRNGLKQVLINLIKNAAEAMLDGGTLIIETQDLINMNGKQYVELTISDSGPGISDEVLANLFSPISTTKGENHSGLGLSICKSIIDEMEGMISCQKQENSGTKFVLLLPRKIAKGMS